MIGGFKHVRMKFRKGRHLFNLTKKSQDIKKLPLKRTYPGKRGSPAILHFVPVRN
jgi:hypothetical protein